MLLASRRPPPSFTSTVVLYSAIHFPCWRASTARLPVQLHKLARYTILFKLLFLSSLVVATKLEKCVPQPIGLPHTVSETTKNKIPA